MKNVNIAIISKQKNLNGVSSEIYTVHNIILGKKGDKPVYSLCSVQLR